MTQPRPSIAATPLDQAMRLGVIYNTHSGRHRKRWVTHALPGQLPAVEANNPDEIRSALAELAARDVNLLAVAGGDGTVQSVLTEIMLGDLFKQIPLLALIPTGSTNMTGSDVGTVDMRRDGWQRLQAWAQQPDDLTRRVVHRPVLNIQPNNTDAPFCGMFMGAGAIHHAVQHTQGNLHNVGLRGDLGPGLALMQFAKSIARRDRRFFSPVDVRLEDAHGNQVDGEHILLMASTLNRLLLNFFPFWGSESEPLHWSAVADDARAFLRRIPAVCRGKGRGLRPEHGYHSHNSSHVEMHFDGGYIVDGEFFTARRQDGPVVLSLAGEAAFLNL